ncbi:hypothetical protein LCGC14_3050340 [marine sediment metagenome]|uniref:Uncharacterized protein n=1 Tax=marine sediment metagenome TaxID=412755 RepID=A0A0F8ZCW7_9ZZZZ
MGSHSLIIAPDIVSDSTLSLKDIFITTLWHPFRFKASKEAFSWRVVPAITLSAHALNHAVTTSHGFSKCLASVMRALIRVKQHPTGSKSRLICHL